MPVLLRQAIRLLGRDPMSADDLVLAVRRGRGAATPRRASARAGWPTSSPSTASATSSSCCSRARWAAAHRPITSFCPVRPAWARPRWPTSSRPSWVPGIRTTSGPAIERSGDLAAILTSLAPGDVLFIDEIHRIAKPAEELLYSAMEDFRVDVVVGKGPGATAIPLDVEPFTLVGATTRAGLLTGPMRDRFGFVGAPRLLLGRPTWTRCCTARRGSSACRSPTEGAAEIAGRSRGTPRIANRLLRRVRDYAEVRADGVVNEATPRRRR